MIDFKKELLKFKPVRTLDELQDGIVTGDISDINEILLYIANADNRSEPGEKNQVPRDKTK